MEIIREGSCINYSEIFWVVTHIIVWGIGVTTGMYFATQIEKDIDKRTKK
tara:strand:+ start:415 stop:564 length:150 start_codon:yes stop_codon:yes gene_type:complete